MIFTPEGTSGQAGYWNPAEMVVIAYEPIWAINTTKLCSQDQTSEAMRLIYVWVNDNVNAECASKIKRLYAGPVTETNAETLIKLHNVDGFLIGSMSCKPGFRKIFEIVLA